MIQVGRVAIAAGRPRTGIAEGVRLHEEARIEPRGEVLESAAADGRERPHLSVELEGESKGQGHQPPRDSALHIPETRAAAILHAASIEFFPNETSPPAERTGGAAWRRSSAADDRPPIASLSSACSAAAARLDHRRRSIIRGVAQCSGCQSLCGHRRMTDGDGRRRRAAVLALEFLAEEGRLIARSSGSLGRARAGTVPI